jgi:hypothetical protein
VHVQALCDHGSSDDAEIRERHEMWTAVEPIDCTIVRVEAEPPAVPASTLQVGRFRDARITRG